MNLRKTAKWLAHSYCPGLTGWFRYFGTRVFFPRGAWIYRIACEEGIYEADILTLIVRLLPANTWFFDIGANIGLMSVPILSQRPDARVLSLEPSPNSIPYLQRTWRECKWKDRWELRSMAAGERKGIAQFSFGPASLAGFDGLQHTQRVARIGTHPVEVTTLDDQWIALGRPQVSFIKMDIEGAEIHALNGTINLIKACQPYVIVEWYEDNLAAYAGKVEDLLDFAREFAYDVVAVPTMSLVTTEPFLRVLMAKTSAFMLVPAAHYSSRDEEPESTEAVVVG